MKHLPILLCALTLAKCVPIYQDRQFFIPANNALSNSNNEFTVKLYKELIKDGGNLIASPFSAATALAMLLEGSKGKTAAEIENLLSYNNFSRPQLEESFKNTLQSLNKGRDYSLAIANSVWVKDGFPVLETFKQKCTDIFDAEEGTFKFPEGHLPINQWVDGKTNHKIPALLDELESDAVMLLLNAIYFKGAWKVAFNTSDNTEELFKSDGYSSKPQTFMNVNDRFQYKDSDRLNAQILRLPYKGKDMSMVLVLPKRGNRLSDIESRLTSNDLIYELATSRSRKVSVTLPKFKIESSLDLKKTLQTLGMRDAFTSAADLSGIYTGPGIFLVSKVIQKAVIEVNEEGSEAAAATAIITVLRTAHNFDYPVEFKADHPFIFFLYHEPTNTILFMGRYTKPSN